MDVKSRVSLKEYADSKLRKAGKLYICPFCDSGEGPNRTPAFSIKQGMFKCFSCGEIGDVFDLAAKVDGIAETDKRGQLEAVASWAGYPLEGEQQARQAQPRKQEEKPKPNYKQAREKEAQYLAWARENVTADEAIRYLAMRGIGLVDAQDKGIGYDPDKKRLVIPWKGCEYYHADRDITGNAQAKYLYPKSDEVGPRPLYNPDALSAPVVFVVEGALDALAVEYSGYQAIALGSNRNIQLADEMSAKGYGGAVVLMLDNDEPGRAGAEDTAAALDALNIPYIYADLEQYKDAAEAYKEDRAGFKQIATHSYWRAEQEKERREAQQYAKALEGLRVFDPVDVAANIWDVSKLQDPVRTGINGLDELLGGGLPRGLVVLGALSSVGKTTFSLQVADTMAAEGQPVLFVTIEQSAQEIVAKSLSRIMRQRFGRGGGYMATAQEIVSRQTRENWGDKQQLALYGALEHYSSAVAKNMRIFEGRKQPTVSDIRQVAELMEKRHGVAPVIFIDYLQLIAPADDRDGTKEATDHNITELRQLARELQTPVFVISSLNRSSYGKGVTLDSFKESGAIEYGADVLLGLQPAGMTEKLDQINNENTAKKEADRMTRESKAKTMRECELIVLKQRNGRMPEKGLNLTFFAPNGLFEEAEEK